MLQRRITKFSVKRTNPARSTVAQSSLEIFRACEDLCRNHDKSTSYRSETDGIVEKAVRRIKEGTSAQFVESVIQREVMECFCSLRNMQDKPSDGKSPCERRFGTPFDGPEIPFGAETLLSSLCERQSSCSPIWYKDASRSTHRIRSEVWRRSDR